MQPSFADNLSPAFKRLIRTVARRINIATWLNCALFPLTMALALFVLALIAAKLFAASLIPWTPLLLLGIPMAWFYAHWRCRREERYFSTDNVIETIDHLYRDDGSVIAAVQSPELFPQDTLLREAVGEVLPHIPRIQTRYYFNRALPLLLAVALAALLPVRKVAPPPQSQEILASITQPLVDKIKELEQILPEKELQDLKQELENLRKSEEGISTEKWEAVEEMEKRMDAAEAKAQQSLSASAEAINKLSEQANAAGNIEGASPAPTGGASEALKDLKAALNANQNLSPEMKKELQDIAGKMSAGESSEELRKRLEELQQKMGKNGQGGGSNPPNGDGPGKGGIDRGRGDAALTFEDEKKLEDAKFNKNELKNNFFTPDDLVDLGITPIKPDPKPGEFSPAVAKQFQNQEGVQVNRTRISPSQKDVVAKYFSNPMDEKK
jgi:hypothetical protein